MRKPQYLSPSALSTWLFNKTEYYLKYLSDNRPPKQKQTRPMSVGSSFDAHIKHHINHNIYGKKDPQFEFKTLFEQQVEEHNRDYAILAGKDCFNQYIASGSFTKLLRLLGEAQAEPRMEFSERATIRCDLPGEFILLGKPDLAWLAKQGFTVNFDWKVKGYCSTSSSSPIRGYINYEGKGAHKDAHIMYVDNFEMNYHNNLEVYNESWARQLCCYSWLAGIPVGQEMVVMVHELVCNQQIRIATHCCTISKSYQEATFRQFADLWATIESGHIFNELSREDSDKRCEMLDRQALAFSGDTKNDEWFRNLYGR